MEFKIIDIHCHPSMKPYNNKGYRTDGNIWLGLKAVREYYDKVPGIIRKQIQETERDSQAFLNEFVKGNIKSGFFVIHPAERGWFSRNTRKADGMMDWFLKRALKLILPERKMRYLAASLTGIHKKKIDDIFDNVGSKTGIDYFTKETYEEYNYIKGNQGTTGSWGFKYEIVNDYADYLRVSGQGKSIPVILTLEGGHALTDIENGDYFQLPYDHVNLPDTFRDKLKDDLKKNIGRLKGKAASAGDKLVFDKNHTPFFVTLSHMYNNFLAGHAKTFGGAIASLLDQVAALNDGITEVGNLAIEELLSKKNGRRILIDVKHLSVNARTEYYNYVRDKRNHDDDIPIICSHAAMNGFEKNDPDREDNMKLEKNSYFSRWSINLSNKDIKEIHESDGIIGLVIHEGRMPGKRAKKQFQDLKKQIKKGKKDTYKFITELKKSYLRLIISNIFQVVTTINNKEGWKHIGIGSDYDGIMDPFDYYKTSGTFQDLLIDIHEYLTNPSFDLIIYKNNNETPLFASDVPNYFFGLTPDQIIENIGYKNVELFLSKYFIKQYLT